MQETVILLTPADVPALYGLYAWGINIIKVIQNIKNPALTVFMKGISSLGTEFFYIIIILLVFWCVDEKKGFRMGLVIVISAWLNSLLKYLLNQPRPFNFEPLLGLAFEPSNGFPSGHAQISLTFWIAAAFYFAKGKLRKPLWIISAVLILLIGFSRLYLGVHFPTDVFGGWVIACAVLVLFYFGEKKAAPLLINGGKRLQLIITAAAVLVMNAVFLRDTSLPALMLGFCAGYSLMIKDFPFTAKNDTGKTARFSVLVLRSVIGLAGFAVIYVGLKMVFPASDSLFSDFTFLEPYYEIFRFIRYGLLGLWAAAGAPKVFINFGLAVSQAAPASAKKE